MVSRSPGRGAVPAPYFGSWLCLVLFAGGWVLGSRDHENFDDSTPEVCYYVRPRARCRLPRARRSVGWSPGKSPYPAWLIACEGSSRVLGSLGWVRGAWFEDKPGTSQERTHRRSSPSTLCSQPGAAAWDLDGLASCQILGTGATDIETPPPGGMNTWCPPTLKSKVKYSCNSVDEAMGRLRCVVGGRGDREMRWLG